MHLVGDLFELYDDARTTNLKYLENSEMWCWKRINKISWTDCMSREEVLQGDKEDRNILHAVKRKKANWIGYILLRNCFLKHFT